MKNQKGATKRRFRSGAHISTLAALLAVGLSAPAQAQLATKHYLPPIVAYDDSTIVLELTTPSPEDVTYTIRSKTGGLHVNGASTAAIQGTVKRGHPLRHEFARDDNTTDGSGGLSVLTSGTLTVFDQYGLIVEASAVVTVTMYQIRSNNRDIITSKGGNAPGTDFYLWSHANTPEPPNDINVAGDSVHFFSVMALEDGTTVQVSGGAADLFSNFDASNGSLSLNAFQTVSLRTTKNRSITGVRLRSNKNITVTSGDLHPLQRDGGSPRDGAVDQLVSVDFAGTDYVIGNIGDANSYGVQDHWGSGIGNRYVQIVALESGTTIDLYSKVLASGGVSSPPVRTLTGLAVGSPEYVHLNGWAGSGHYFKSNKPFLLFLNSSGTSGGEMGGAALPALRGLSSQGSFCSGTDFVELTQPGGTQAFLVYLPLDKLNTLQVDFGAGWVPYTSVAATLTEIEPPTPLDKIAFVRFPRSTGDGERVAFRAESRMHVSVGTSPSGTGSFGYFSDYNIGFLIRDPKLHLPADSYQEPESLLDSSPRTIRHCIDTDSVCSSGFLIESLTLNKSGLTRNLSTLSAPEDPCFEFTPNPEIGLGTQAYTVRAIVLDSNGDRRTVDVIVSVDWPDADNDGVPDAIERPGGVERDTDGDGIPDHLDPDDDGDGILTRHEIDKGDTDGDGKPDYLDPDDDGDGILTIDEDADPNGDGNPDDALISDGGTVPDYLNPNEGPLDTDGDGIPDHIERPGGVDRDTDGDGIPDHLDPDDDGDGIPTRDERPFGDRDTDGDGIPDHLDDDDDDDGVPTKDERPGGVDRDTDGDGIPDHLDPDDDGDGILTRYEDLDEDGDPTNDDTDGDGIPNYLDPDDDGDGILTIDEDADPNGDGNPDDALVSPGGNGVPDYLNPYIGGPDSDGDGIPDHIEKPGGVERDTDGDGIPDHLDPDDDGDGIPTRDERPFGDRDTDGDGIPDHLDPDDDGDSVPTKDERPGGVNRDTDGDGIPDHLDADDDGDGILTKDEDVDGDGNPQNDDTDGDGIPNFLDADDDGDGIPTRDERPNGQDRDTDSDGIPDHLDADDDGDGIPTKDERPNGKDRDTDGDGIPDHLDADDDGDGILTRDERPNGKDRDTDGDGVPDHLDDDDDGDGIPTRDERPNGKDRDTDGDGVPDHLDDDDDGDGVPTKDEPGDRNNNGIPDYLEESFDGSGAGSGGSGDGDGDDSTDDIGDGDDGSTSGGFASLEGGGFGCSVPAAPIAPSVPWALGLLTVIGAALRRRRN